MLTGGQDPIPSSKRGKRTLRAKNRAGLYFSSGLRVVWMRIIPVAAVTAFFALHVAAQISVRAAPPAVLVETTGTVSLSAQVLGTLPGENTGVLWSLNDRPASTSPNVSFSPVNGPPGVPIILKANSLFDPSKFAAVPVVPLQKSTLAQIGFPEAVTYHPGTGKIYVAALVSRGTAVDTNIIEVSADGSQAQVLTFPTEIIDKLLPYSSGGSHYLLSFGLISGSVNALNLGAKTFRRVVTGLENPVSGAFHPVSGDLYIAEQRARRLSVVSRSALDSAVSGTTTASSQPLPITVPEVSGVSFLADRDSKKVALLATSTTGFMYKVNLDDNSFGVVASGLLVAQELLVLESSTLGFSFILSASPTRIDGQGQILAVLPPGGDQPFGRPYGLATGLDTLTDIAFVPAGSPYSAQGKPLIAVSNSSPTPSRGSVVLWEVDPAGQEIFFAYNDQARPSLSLVSPGPGAVLAPGAPVDVRWRIAETNPVNPSNAHFPEPADILVSTDGGNSFFTSGPTTIPSGPQNNEYQLPWQVPANLAGSGIRLRVQTRGLGGSTLAVTSTGDINILPLSGGSPRALSLNPNFVVAGETATVTVDGLNFQAETGVSLGDGISVDSASPLSSSRLLTDVTVPALAPPGPRNVLVCNSAILCEQTENAFFALPSNAPRITSIQPQSGAPGASVLITGSNFSPVASDNAVTFGNLGATVSLAQPGRLVVQVPFGRNWGKLPLSMQTNGVASNTADFFLRPPGFSFPSVNRDGIVNAASYAPGTSSLAAGSIGSVFGANMAPSIAGAAALPLPRDLLGTSFLIGGIYAPLFFASPNQMNLQLPEEIRGLNSVAVTVFSRGLPGNTVLLNLATQSPGIFSVDGSGKGLGAVLNQDGRPNGPGNPERIGNVLQVYATGLGDSSPAVATGAAAPGDPPSTNVNPPQVTIDGKAASAVFSGRAPGAAGLDQINVVIPAGVTTGSPVPLVLTAGANVSNTVTVYIAP